jgi:hypothetical protein
MYCGSSKGLGIYDMLEAEFGDATVDDIYIDEEMDIASYVNDETLCISRINLRGLL